jgi:tetratricopeptide (TPR) repeat protein
MKKNWIGHAAISALLLSGLAAGTVSAAEEITECDRLVSHPLDPDRVTTGVPTSKVDHPAGIAACEAAVKADPDSARAHYQLGRVYFYDGQADKALPHLEIAAAANHRQTMFVLGYILDSGQGGVEPDTCRTEALWARAARAGRLAALVSYPHHVVRGRFDDCTVQVSNAEMMGFLEQAQTFKLDYYQGVLLEDVIDDLTAYMDSK